MANNQTRPNSQEIAKEVSEQGPTKQERGSRNRNFALAYAKDLAVAKIMVGRETRLSEILAIATAFESYLDTGIVTAPPAKEEGFRRH